MTFEQVLRSHGFMPKAIVPDGRIRRCRTDAKPNHFNGWYVLHPDGRGVFGDWTTGSSEPIGRWHGEHVEFDPAALKAARDRKLHEKRAAITRARAWWSDCKPITNRHDYLERKGLTLSGTGALRMRGGRLVAPVMGHRGLISVQTIDARGEKRFFPGAPVRGGSLLLPRRDAAVTVLCEGLSTGLAVYQSVRAAKVIVAYFADNIAPVAKALQPTGSVVIAADNDWRTERKIGSNPGIEKARAVADEIGCGVAYPQDIDGTDWADWLKEVGDRAAHQMQQKLLAEAKYVMRM